MHQLPTYSLESNPTERLWQDTRKNATNNRYFETKAGLVGTLSRVFGDMQSHPELIRSYVLPSCWPGRPFIYARMYTGGLVVSRRKSDPISL